MPCFAHVRDAASREYGRREWRSRHMAVGVLSVPFVVLALTVTLLGVGPSLLLPVVAFGISLVAWFLYVPCNLGRRGDQDKAIVCTIYSMLLFACTIVLALFAFQEPGSSGVKMVPLFMLSGPWLLLSLVVCEEGRILERTVGCAGLVFVGGLVTTLILVALKIDGNLPSTPWVEVFTGTWVSDPFCLLMLTGLLRDRRWGFSRPENADVNAKKISVTSILVVLWIVWFMFRICFVIRQDNISEYYSLGSRNFVNMISDEGAIPVVAYTSPLLFFGVYMLCGGFQLPAAVTYDANRRCRARNMAQRQKAREDEREARDNARRAARDVFQNRTNTLIGLTSGKNDLENADGGIEMIAVPDEPAGVSRKSTGGDAERGVASKTALGNAEVSKGHNLSDVNITIASDENEMVKWSEALNALREAESEEMLLGCIKDIIRLLDAHPRLQRTDERMQLISVAKRKQATHKESWTQPVALAFRGALDRFSVLAAPLSSLRQFSSNLKLPFRQALR